MTGAGAHRVGDSPTPPNLPGLDGVVVERSAYDAYVRRQAQELLDLVPREGLRSLYGRAREWARERGIHDGKDPMATLIRYCEEILPLPPFRVWLQDVARNADGHVAQMDRDPDGSVGAEDSLPLETRSFVDAGERWYAVLGVYRAREAWGGLIRFHRGPDTPVLHTASVFRGREPGEVADRFRSFDDSSLRAFLRSVRP